MSLLLINTLLIAFGLWLVVGGLYGLAVVAGLPRPPRPRYPQPRPARPSPRWVVTS